MQEARAGGPGGLPRGHLKDRERSGEQGPVAVLYVLGVEGLGSREQRLWGPDCTAPSAKGGADIHHCPAQTRRRPGTRS